MDHLHYEHCLAFVTALEQDEFFLKIHAQIPSDAGVSGRELASRIEQISGHLRRVKGCDSVSHGQLAFARTEDSFHRARALTDGVDGRVLVKFIDYGHEEWILLQDFIIVDPPLSDVLTTVRPLADEFLLDGIIFQRPLSSEEIVQLSEKILFQALSSRIRRVNPDVALIELATPNNAGGRPENLRNLIYEAGYGKKVSVEDIAKYLRIKPSSRPEEIAAANMQPGSRQPPYSTPPPNMMIPPPQNIGSPTILTAASSVNTRLTRFKKDSGSEWNGTGPLPGYQHLAMTPPLADRKQYADGRLCTTAPTLPVNSTHNAYISHVEDGPYLFYVQLKASVEQVLPKLKNILARNQCVPVNAQLIPGSVVVAKSSDDTLRRGVVMNLTSGSCKIYYIDFGHLEDRPLSDLYNLPNTAADLSPAMAIQFCLADLGGVKVTDGNKDYFSRLLLGKQVFLRVTEKESNSPFQFCDIIWEGRSVREILVNLNSPMQYQYQLAPSSRETSVSVIYADSPNQFYVQYRSELSVIGQIQEALAAHCKSQPRIADVGVNSIGSPVAAIFPEDETWYRALIMGMDSNKINVFYVDYGNRAEVTSNQICALTRDLVNKWKAQAVECCLVGFDSATPDNFMAGKMEETVLGNTYSLRLHSILSGFRLNVDLIDEQGNSVASKMKAILEERQKALPYTSTHSPPKKAMSPEEDKLSQHSSDGGGSGKKNKFPRPPLRSDREKERGSKFEQRTERTKVEDRQSPFHQHDDRSGGSLKADSTQKEDVRGEWKKSAKKPHMDQESGWGSTGSKPENGSWNDKQDSGTGPKKSDWRSSDGASKGRFNSDRGDKGEWSDRGTSRDGDRKGGFNNRFERKPSNNDEDSWGSKDRKFAARGERDGKFGDKDNRSGDWSNKFGDRDKKFGDRGNRFGDRDKFNGERGSKFGGRDKPSFRDNQKPRWNNDDSQASGKTQIAENNDDWDDELTTPVVHAPSVAISEYPHQRIIVGQEYQVLFVGMETPNKVYVQISGCDPVLEKIRGIIDADVGASSRPLMPTRIALGMPVLARFLEDGLLYRAMVKSVKYSAAEVDVLFVDYGNSASIPVGEVYTISSEAMDVPVQAIHVEISDIPDNIPVDVATSQAYFEEVDYFILKPSSICVINLAQVVTGTLIRSDGISIADRLRTCYEMNTDPAQQAQVKTNIPSAEVNPDPVQSSTSAPTQEAVAEPSNKDIPEVNTVVSPKPDHWIERLDFLVGQTLRAVVTAVAEDSYLIKIPDALDLTVLARSEQCISHEVKSGTEVIVKVNALADDRLSADFYNRGGESLSGGPGVSPICPMPIVSRKGMYNVSHKEGEMLYLHPTDSIEQLSGFLEVLYNKYESSSLTANDTFALDDFCVAKSPLDENWYRARITNVEGSTLTVYYVDYGNSERVNRENVRKLEQPFFEPAMCVGVSLPLKYNDVVEGMPKVFDSLEDPLECTFIKKGSSAWIVDLCKADTNENFALKWIAANQAVSVGPISANPKKREPGWNLKKHDVIKVVLSHADSPNSFFVQLKKDIVDIDELQSKLTLLPEDGDLGEVFAAKYLADNAWYRAVSVGDQVRFIDYGNTDFATERKKLTDDLIHPIGGYAMPLVIKIKPKGDDWTEEAASAFDEFSEGELTAEIISVDFETVVDLLRGTKSLTRCLVDGGHAVLTDVQQKSVEAVGTNDLPVQSVPLPPVISKSFYKNCVFCHSNGPYDFYLQTDDDRISVEEMENALFGPGAFPSLNEVKKGDFVVAQFSEDDAYYRAVVTEDQPEVVVNFIDYGNSCPATVFHQLPDKLKDIPSLAIRCSLQSPMGGWSVDAIDKFSEFLNPQSKSIDLKIITKGDPNIVDVEINGASVTKLLAPDAKFEQNDDPVVAPIAVEESSRVQEVDEQVAVVAELQTKLVLSESEESKTESSYIITIPYAVSPSEFYCKEVAEEEKIMSESLSSADKFAPIEKYEVGQLVCAQFPDDELWYRARVESLEPTTVFFVDFGNDSEVTNVRALPDDLSKIPPLCFKASLTPQVQPWTEEETNKFLSVAVVGEFNCTIVERTPDLAVVQLSSADKSDMITFLGRSQ